MKKKYLAPAASASVIALLGITGIAAESVMASRIESQVRTELANSSEITASIPIFDIPQNLVSSSIKSAKIAIGRYSPDGGETTTSLEITAKEISKKKPTIVGSLDIKVIIPAATILENAEFENAQIVGNTLKIPMGANGLGQAELIPKYSKDQIFFQLKSVSILGNKIPASALPEDVQDQVKGKSIRTIDVPDGLKVSSVSISSEGLSIKLRGSDIQLGKLGSIL